MLFTLGSVTAAGWLYRRVRAYESRHGVSVLRDRQMRQAVRKKPGTTDRTGKNPDASNETFRVFGNLSRFDSASSCVRLMLSHRPDESVLRSYVSVSPLRKGLPSLSVHMDYLWSGDGWKRYWVLDVGGAFEYGTNVTVRLKKGLPVVKEDGDGPSLALDEDFVYGFKNPDRSPRVRFAAKGRYLPPAGRRSLGVESVNVSRLALTVRPVAPENVVTCLALESGEWNHIDTKWRVRGDSYVSDLAGAGATREIPVFYERNVSVETECPLAGGMQALSNGLYFVTALSKRWFDETHREPAPVDLDLLDGLQADEADCRLVCLTDLAVNVRQTANGVYVWVTSLTTGLPVGGADVRVYSSANRLVADGRTDENGWCACARCEEGEPFAVVVTAADGSDRSFLAIGRSSEVEEPGLDDSRERYLDGSGCTAFSWTERGIYRHGEKVCYQAIVRNGKGLAPKQLPLELELVDPEEKTRQTASVLTDARGSVVSESFAVPDDWPSGEWKIVLKTPGEKGAVLSTRAFKVEEFAPPQIRVSVACDRGVHPTNFAFSVSSEYLFGGPARACRCEGVVLFEDVPFQPKGWDGYAFGNPGLGLSHAFRRLPKVALDANGQATLAAPIWADWGRPAAAVRATGQATVFENGGRPATRRESVLLHYYPFYLGTSVGGVMRRPEEGSVTFPVACVLPDGRRLGEGRRLTVRTERLEPVYSYRRTDDGWGTWDCERILMPAAKPFTVESVTNGDTSVVLPIEQAGDYRVTVTDEESGVSLRHDFYLGDADDSATRATLSKPTAVSLTADKAFYRPGEKPRLLVKSPFAGTALVTVFRDALIYGQVLTLTNATSEIDLPAVFADCAPNLDVSLVVVQGVAAASGRLAVRAHGEVTLPVRRAEDEVEVDLSSRVESAERGSRLVVDLAALGAGGPAEMATVAVVDEGINMLTSEPEPDPIACLATPRRGTHVLYDLYDRVLPVFGDPSLVANGAKTGGDTGAGLLGRVSLAPSRRFRPLALWRTDVPLTNGCGQAVFDLPEFAGEVRVTAVAYGSRATGAAAVRRKVSPKLVMQPDAPRFVAPEDAFSFVLPLHNRADAAGDVRWAVAAESGLSLDPSCAAAGTLSLERGASTNLRFRAVAGRTVGSGVLRFRSEGFGERHETTIDLPVRPAVAWRETAGLVCLAPGEAWKGAQTDTPYPDAVQRVLSVGKSPVAELKAALQWLADYPHGCLEQTASRLFPLITADGLLNAVDPSAIPDRRAYVKAGVERVLSMFRGSRFVMWPDCSYEPWDPEVGIYAAHFLFEADRSPSVDVRLPELTRNALNRFLRRSATNPTNAIAAYACQVLALGNAPERDSMLRLYDARASLDLVSRARLARAFVLTADLPRARTLLDAAAAPASVPEAAFLLLALCEAEPTHPRIHELADWLLRHRDTTLCSWGTTASNAQALLALGAYYRCHPPKEGDAAVTVRQGDGILPLESRAIRLTGAEEPEVRNAGPGTAYVSWKRLELPRTSVAETSGPLTLMRRYRTDTGDEADLSSLACGDFLIVELELSSSVDRSYGDLVIEDLLPGAFEPVFEKVRAADYPWVGKSDGDWVMRSDLRDDRALVFSKKIDLVKVGRVVFRYPVRVVSPGTFVLPGASVEAMYQPEIRSRLASGTVTVACP